MTVEITREEGGAWEEATFEGDTLALLEVLSETSRWERDAYVAAEGDLVTRASVRLPTEGGEVSVHSVRLPDGRIWDSHFRSLRPA